MENGGYRMVRGTHGVNYGAYYWEIHILDPPIDIPIDIPVEPIKGTDLNTDAINLTTSDIINPINIVNNNSNPIKIVNNNSNPTSTTTNKTVSHYRVGWSTRQGELEGPVGFDKFRYFISFILYLYLIYIFNISILYLMLLSNSLFE